MRAYTSANAGRTWRSEVVSPVPGSGSDPCHADPAPAIGVDGTEYVAFMQATGSCEEGGERVTIRLAIRPPGETAWRYRTQSVLPEVPGGSFDDNPWLAVDSGAASPHRGRLYLAWFRSVGDRRLGFQISHSDDGGASWSSPRTASDSIAEPGYPSLSIATDGTVYAAWHDFGRRRLLLDRSGDGGETFGRDVALPLRGRDARDCPNGRPIPAQPFRCVRSDPTVLVDTPRNRVYLTYSDLARNGSEDVFVTAYDAELRRVRGFPRRVGGAERRPRDQFWPAAAVDPGTGRLVLCFYVSGAGSARTRAAFSCAVSAPLAARWAAARPVARVASDETRPGGTEFAYGDYEGLAIAVGVAHPIWTDSRNLATRGEEIYTAAFRIGGTLAARPPRQVDVSKAPGSQNEPAVAVDPKSPSVLIASSNSIVAPMSVYTSTNGGLSWTAQPVPPDAPDGLCLGDPAVAIDTRGREYFAFLRDEPCAGRDERSTALLVATRAGSSGPWAVPRESLAGPLQPGESNDKPAIAADTSASSPHRDRVYVAWARAVGSDIHHIVVSHTDDGGSSWSAPVTVDDSAVDSGYPSVATGPGGEVYVAWHPFEEDRTVIAASYDGGATFGAKHTIDVKRNRSSCPASWPIPAQARRCVRPNPIVSVDTSGGSYRGRVYVTYENKAAGGTQRAYVAAFDRELAPILGAPAGRPLAIATRARPVRYRTDQFWPVSAVDRQTGALWACFYDTAGNRKRRLAWFSCARSRDGGATWSAIRRAATTPSDATKSWVSEFQYGDYEGLAVVGGVAHPVWTDTRRGRSSLAEEIYTTRVGS